MVAAPPSRWLSVGSGRKPRWHPLRLFPRSEHMLISSWIGYVQRTLALKRNPKSPRRRGGGGFSVQCAQVEEFESRAMLSAPAITLSPPGPLNYVENSGAVVIAPNSTVTDDASVTTFTGGTLTESLTVNANA